MNQIHNFLNNQKIQNDLITRLAYARDASLYRLVPKFVARPQHENDVKQLLKYARTTKTPITFRSGGTSLSGQSVSNGIIAEVLHEWKTIAVKDDGHAIKMQPGVNAAFANKILERYSRRIGPDPASINAACIGGIISNNSSGMVCGTQFNSYHTLQDISFILPNGNKYSTSMKNHNRHFVSSEPELANGLLEIRKKIISKQWLLNKIRDKYKIKNTIGYSMNSFLDFVEPLDIFSHLLVGAEGTLAFISDVTLKTIPNYDHKATGLLLFNSPESAGDAVNHFKQLGASAIEFLDDQSLRTAKYYDNPPYNPSSINDDNTGLLVEFQNNSDDEIFRMIEESQKFSEKNKAILSLQIVKDNESRETIWKIRKGLYPTLGSLRKTGTSVITEDIAVNSIDLAPAIRELKNIFSICDFNDGVIYGHAKDGNIHFQTSIDLDDKTGVNNFEKMMNHLSTMTIKTFNGSLKAEHGTGRNMASFVKAEWGGEIFDLMWKIKRLVDPEHIMNPDVLLTRDQKLHMKNLKPMPKVHQEVDSCVECGFCEKVCPSRGLTLTPRQRIGIMRETNDLKLSTNDKKQLEYFVNETCATDGLCSIQCPVNINTGSMVKDLRYDKMIDPWFVRLSSHYFNVILSLIRFGIRSLLNFQKLTGNTFLRKITIYLNKVTNGVAPIWPRSGLKVADKILFNNLQKPDYFHFSSCVNRVLAGDISGKSASESLINIAFLVGKKLCTLETINKQCCGMAFSSRGYVNTGKILRSRLIQTMIELTNENNDIPIIVDMSPCTQYLLEDDNISNLKIIDSISFLNKIKNKLEFNKSDESLFVHSVCSIQKMGISEELIDLVSEFHSNIELPIEDFCCGTAGDRGFRFPELTKNAVLRSVNDQRSKTGVSSSRTCEIGLENSLNMQFCSIEALVYNSIKR